MKNEHKLTETNREYAAAYAAHYREKNLPKAIQLYKQVMTAHPGRPEADYARMQIQNIINAVVPKQELLDAQMELALAHFEHHGPRAAA